MLAVCTPGWLMFPLLVLHLWLLLLEGAVLSALKGSWRPWREIYWPVPGALWRERRRLRAARRQAQASRRIGVMAFFAVFVALPVKLRLLLRHGVPGLR